MKKVISFILVILMVCNMGIYMVQAAGADTSVKISDSSASPGENVEVYIRLDCPKGIKTITFYDFVYDDTKVEIVKSECAWLADGILKDIDFNNNASIITFVNNTPYTDNMLKLVFKVAEDAEIGSIPISCSVIGTRMINKVETKIDIDFTAGSIKVVDSKADISDFNYTLKDDGIVITGYKGKKTKVEIADSYKIKGVTYNVVGIDEFAFKSKNFIKSVVIPATVKSIGAGAFYDCDALTSATIYGKTTTIGEKALGYYYISKNEDGVVENFTIYGRKGSKAQKYAERDKRITFVTLSGECEHLGGEANCVDKAICTLCGEAYGEIDKTNHKSVAVSKVAPTCTKSGTKTYKCTACKKVLKTEKLDKVAHTYKTVITKATTSKSGSKVVKCEDCGKVKSKSTIAKISSVKLSTTSYTYNGNKKTPTVTVKDSKGNKLKNGTDYTVKYSSSSRKNVGTYTVTVTFKGNYSGTKKLTFKIVPKSTSISKLTAGKKSFTAKWSKQSTQTTGYQIQYSTSSKMANASTKTISKNSTTSQTIKSLKSGKKYYVRIRTYKTVNGSKIYSSWSSVKSVKTK